jgi:hypothetical protein
MDPGVISSESGKGDVEQMVSKRGREEENLEKMIWGDEDIRREEIGKGEKMRNGGEEEGNGIRGRGGKRGRVVEGVGYRNRRAEWEREEKKKKKKKKIEEWKKKDG